MRHTCTPRNRSSCRVCIEAATEREDMLRAIGWVLAAGALVFVLTLIAGCSGCQTAYRFDGGPLGSRAFYKVELCRGEKPRVLCDSPDPLPNADCE